MYCNRCDTDLAGKNPYVQITGYIQHRPQGGSNHVLLKEKTGRLLCESCMALMKSGPQGQTRLG